MSQAPHTPRLPSPQPPQRRSLLGLCLWVLLLVGWVCVQSVGCEKAPPAEPTPDAGPTEPADAAADTTPDVIAESSTDTAPDAGGSEGALEKAPHRDYPLDDTLKLNHIQAKGTHNSYHLDPGQGVDEWRYSHAPLDVQLGKQGVRQFELDVNWNAELEAFLVYHIPILDQKTTCYRFTDCLKVIKRWSDANPQHLPIFVFIEPKTLGKKPPLEAFAALEKEAQSIFAKERLITPDGLRGSHPNLKEAVAKDGWPTLGKVRGKIVFVLLMGGTQRELYTNGDKDLKGRLMFVTADPGSPYAAVIKLDGPVGDEEKIKAAVKAGAIVRTRADSGLEPSKRDNTKRLEAALRSGAHFLSTDYPAPVKGVKYFLEIPGGTPVRCNPVTAPANCTSGALEQE